MTRLGIESQSPGEHIGEHANRLADGPIRRKYNEALENNSFQ